MKSIKPSFMQIFNEVVATKRENMIHFSKMKPAEFVQISKWLLSEFGGVLNNKSVDVSLKVDGAGLRFGKDDKGKYFMETSRSGPIFNSGAFSKFQKDQGVTDPVRLNRAVQYDDVFDILKTSKLVKTIPNGCKVICELMYNNMGEDLGDSVKFVTVAYNKSKIGKQMTIVPFTVVDMDGNEHTDSKKIIESLYKASNSDILVVNPSLRLQEEIDVSMSITRFLKEIEKFDLSVMSSRKRTDTDVKNAIRQIVQDAINEIESLIAKSNIQGINVMGDEIEGLVIKIGNKLFKIQSDNYKQSRKR